MPKKHKGELIVTDRGIEKVVQVYSDTEYATEIVIPRNVFVEAFNKFVIMETKGGEND